MFFEGRDIRFIFDMIKGISKEQIRFFLPYALLGVSIIASIFTVSQYFFLQQQQVADSEATHAAAEQTFRITEYLLDDDTVNDFTTTTYDLTGG